MQEKVFDKITGKVVVGDGYGRKLGFPTVNLEFAKDGPLQNSTEGLPPPGVYAGTASLMSRGILDTYRAGILINPNGKVEAHLIGFSGDAYDKEVILQLNKFLREYKKFEKEAALKVQIEKDLEMC